MHLRTKVCQISPQNAAIKVQIIHATNRPLAQHIAFLSQLSNQRRGSHVQELIAQGQDGSDTTRELELAVPTSAG
jgi:ABC-type cobalamin/Fe3+-siderophores transport system ATPase subunit